MPSIPFKIIKACSTSSCEEKKNVVINDIKEWQKCWDESCDVRYNSKLKPIPFPPAPSIDFEQHTVCAIFLGIEGSVTHFVEEIEVNEDEQKKVYIKARYERSEFQSSGQPVLLIELEKKLQSEKINF